MKSKDQQAVDAYLQNVPEPERNELERIRSLVKKYVPVVTEEVSYMMPTFKYKKKPLLYYAAFKNHLSLFPTPGPTASLNERLAAYQTSKGTIKFTLKNTLPDELIEEILTCRISEIDKEA